MDMILKRTLFRQDGVLGELTSDNGAFHCATLEHAYAVNSHFEPKIPTGLYTCVRGYHRLSQMPKAFETFEIVGVKGHTGILFHQGNFNNDSEGCVLVGEYDEPKLNKRLMVVNSVKIFESFMKMQAQAKTFTLTVIDHNFSDVAYA